MVMKQKKTDAPIATKALIVQMSISTYGGRKFDRGVSDDIIEQNKANSDSGRFNKKLFPGQDILKSVHNLACITRAWHYSQTLRWSIDGFQLLPTKNFVKYTQDLNKKFAELDAKWAEFLEAYDDLRANDDEKLKEKLGDMYNPKDYKSKAELMKMHGHSISFFPLPADDFLIDLSDDAADEIRAKVTHDLQASISDAMAELWSRLKVVVDHMAEKLGNEKSILHTNMVKNLNEICEIIPRLNLTGDQKLEAIRQEVLLHLASCDIESLRKDKVSRSAVADQAQAIVDKMAAYMGGNGK